MPSTIPPPSLPNAVVQDYDPFVVTTPGCWLVLSDVHLPYHSVAVVELAFAEAKKRKVDGVLLNGDILDAHELSTFDKDPSAPRYIAEREAALQFFSYLRYKLPKTRIVYKAGNHEERLDRYLMRRAPALFGLKVLSYPSILELDKHGIEWVGDKRVIRLGRLSVIHGHEYQPKVLTPVNPARGVFLRAKGSCLVGHWHQTSEHTDKSITGKMITAWSAGCACQLTPPYSPLNRWNHGFTFVDIHPNLEFGVTNFRVEDGVLR